MNINVEYLKKIYSEDGDFVVRELESGKKDKIYVIFFESLVDSANTNAFIIDPVLNYLFFHRNIKNVESVLGGAKLSSLKKIEDASYYLENGFVLVIFKEKIYSIEIKASLDRGVTASDTEPNMYGPKDSFSENYQKNIGLIKRRIKNSSLKIENVDHGSYTKDRVSLIYIDSKIDKDELDEVKKILNENSNTDVIDSYDIMKNLEKKSIMPTILKTEKPAIVSKFLLKGHIAIVIDNSPFVLILNAKFADFVNPYTTDKFVRVLRYICLILNVLTPAIYIALVNFNQEAIPTELMINFSEQRSGVPFPSVIEAFLMLFICEILRESDIRFPNNYGSSASILGALILGDAAVNAGIVSPIMIIIVAISFISGLIFTDTKFVSALRKLRFGFLLLGSFLGLYGIFLSSIVTLALISDVPSGKENYL